VLLPTDGIYFTISDPDIDLDLIKTQGVWYFEFEYNYNKYGTMAIAIDPFRMGDQTDDEAFAMNSYEMDFAARRIVHLEFGDKSSLGSRPFTFYDDAQVISPKGHVRLGALLDIPSKTITWYVGNYNEQEMSKIDEVTKITETDAKGFYPMFWAMGKCTLYNDRTYWWNKSTPGQPWKSDSAYRRMVRPPAMLTEARVQRSLEGILNNLKKTATEDKDDHDDDDFVDFVEVPLDVYRHAALDGIWNAFASSNDHIGVNLKVKRFIKTNFKSEAPMYIIMLTQICSCIALICWAWAGVHWGDLKWGSQAVLEDLEGFYEVGTFTLASTSTKVLCSVFLFILLIINAWKQVRDDLECDRHLLRLAHFLGFLADHEMVESTRFYIWRIRIMKCWIYFGSCVNLFTAVAITVVMVPAFLTAEGPKDVLFDALGLLFLMNIDDANGDMARIVVDKRFDKIKPSMTAANRLRKAIQSTEAEEDEEIEVTYPNIWPHHIIGWVTKLSLIICFFVGPIVLLCTVNVKGLEEYEKEKQIHDLQDSVKALQSQMEKLLNAER
jgi:hypothetical protein